MKRIFNIAISALALIAFASCGEKEPEAEQTDVEVTECDLAIPAEGGSASITVEAAGSFSATTESSWLSLSVSGNTITATAGANTDLLSRYATVAVKGEKETVNLTVQQYGWQTSGFSPTDIVTSADPVQFIYDYDYSALMEASTDASWIHLTVTSDKLYVNIDHNTTEATDADKSRKAQIKWTLGADHGIINVTQKNLNFMKEDSNWTLTYDGVTTYEGEEVESVTNTVATPDISGKYAIAVVPKDSVDASGLSIADYVDLTLSAEVADEINYYIDMYAQYGYTLTFADFITAETESAYYDIFDAGDYYAFAIGFDDNGETTGHYAALPFTKKSEGGDSKGYDSWLGDWIYSRNGTDETWTLSEKVKGSTYTLSGYAGRTDISFEVEYDSATDGIVIRAQEELGTVTLTTAGKASVGVYGSMKSGTFYRPSSSPYAITVAKKSGNTATLTAQSITTSSGEVTFEQMKYICTAESDGKYYSLTGTDVAFPATITRAGGSGGGDDGGNVTYKSWIGSWKITSSNGDFTIAVSENKSGESYNVRGWQFDDESGYEPMAATYESDGSMYLYADSNNPFATGISVDTDNDPFNLHYVGMITYTDGEEYYITGDDAMAVGCCTLGSDGSAKITGLKVQLSNGGTFDFVRLQVMAFSTKNENAVYSFKSRPEMFPLTMTKTSSSAVRTTSAYAPDYRIAFPAKALAASAPAAEEAQCAGTGVQMPLRFRNVLSVNN